MFGLISSATSIRNNLGVTNWGNNCWQIQRHFNKKKVKLRLSHLQLMRTPHSPFLKVTVLQTLIKNNFTVEMLCFDLLQGCATCDSGAGCLSFTFYNGS